ncbi:MAG: recombinase family protein [Oscillospiraceae bacterium]|nr:recombinase family protein [Oscillospiraceae bacterium]
MTEYRVGIYIRLSLADEDTGNGKAESDSIGNQRELIHQFLNRHPQLKTAPRSEFVDDGYTGTNTNRPQFQALMKELRTGAINVMVTKDFSRCHRDYTQMGNYLECVFPFLGVRYISVNDGYDSDDYKGVTSGMDVVLRNIIYEAYSKDLSIKTTTAKIIMMQQGKYIGSFAPYGFQFHPTIRNRLAIDEESATVVRRIFDMTLQGCGSSAIARSLNSEGILTPGAYFRQKNPGSNRFRKASEKNGWTAAAVLNILHQYEYTGALVGRKRYKASLHEKRRVPQDKADWIIYEGAHDAIISKADFDRVQEIIRQRNTPSRGTPNSYPLKGLLKCGNCHRTLSRVHNSAGYYYRCTKSRTDEASDCPKGKLFSEKEIEGIVFRAIMQMLAMCQERKKQKSSLMLTRKERIAACVAELQKLGQRQERYKQEKFRAYENFNAGELTKDAYLRQRAEIDGKIASAKAEQDNQEQLLSELERLAVQDKAQEDDVFLSYAGATELTAELAGTFIKEILVSSPTEIEIVWKFRDVFSMQDNDNR